MYLPFLFDADELSLDFLNTQRQAAEEGADLLASPDRVVAWLGEAGLASREGEAELRSSPPDARLLMGEAHRLRDGIETMVSALVAATLVPDWAILALNRVLALETEERRVVARDGSYSTEVVPFRRGAAGLLAPVARSAADLLVSADPSRIRRCDSCGLWFRDVSKNGRRRWCSMARCGNRAKVAAHSRRRSA